MYPAPLYQVTHRAGYPGFIALHKTHHLYLAQAVISKEMGLGHDKPMILVYFQSIGLEAKLYAGRSGPKGMRYEIAQGAVYVKLICQN
jgi:hypothetical protein